LTIAKNKKSDVNVYFLMFFRLYSTSIEKMTEISVIKVNMSSGHQSRVRMKVKRLSKTNLASHKTATTASDRLFTLALSFGKGICEI
jgi:hypothetical protein